MATCKPFKGPITSVALIQWVTSCENAFEIAARSPLSDRLKIISAGTVIDAEAEHLFEWWTSSQDTLTQLSWNEFVDDMTSWALGLDWKTRALESFAHTEQGEDAIEQYITKMRAARLVLERAGIQLNDLHYKSQLLFHASPIISNLVQTTPNFNFMGVSIRTLEERMRIAANGMEDGNRKERESSAAGSSGSTSNTPPPYASSGSGQWELSEQWGYEHTGTIPFTQMDSLPPRLDKSSRVISMSLGGDGCLRGVKALIRSDELNKTWTLDTRTISHTTFYDMSIDAGDYVNCVVFTKHGNNLIDSAKIETSRGKTLTAGTIQSETKAFRAKEGQKIVGFHGATYGDRSGITKIGVIYGPLAPREK